MSRFFLQRPTLASFYNTITNSTKRWCATQNVAAANTTPDIPRPPPVNESDKPTVSMKDVFPGTPAITFKDIEKGSNRMRVSTLPSGLRIATLETYSATSAVGLFMDVGSKHEDASHRGCTHFWEKMAFKTSKTRSLAELIELVDNHGMNASSRTSRDSITYVAEIIRDHVDVATNLFADTVLNSALLEDEINEQKEILQLEHDSLVTQPEIYLNDLLFGVAFGKNSPIGQSQYCFGESLQNINATSLRSFQNKFFNSKNMVVGATGVNHDNFVELCAKEFEHLLSNPELSNEKAYVAPSPYTGGMEIVNDTPELLQFYQNIGKQPQTHAFLCFQAPGMILLDENNKKQFNRDFYSLSLLQTLLGSGASFSSGGPGKGMYTRLYKRVLNQFSWCQYIGGASQDVTECTLFGIYGSADSYATLYLVEQMALMLKSLAEDIEPVEFNRAKNMLKSQLFMHLENRTILLEDLARHLLLFDEVVDAAVHAEAIDSLQIDEVKAVAKNMLQTKPTLLLHSQPEITEKISTHLNEDVHNFCKDVKC